MAQLKTIHELDLTRQRVLMRVDFNVPLNDQGGIADDTRIRAALPSIHHCLDQQAAVILMSHLGRPAGKTDTDFSLREVSQRLSELLDGTPVELADDVAGDDAARRSAALGPGQILLLENLRFEPGEQADDDQFAARLRDLADVYVNDAFAVCHRLHASTSAVPKLFPPDNRGIGLLIEQERKALHALIDSPRQPLVVVLGGAKVADKIDVINALLEQADHILLGGVMALTFLHSKGFQTGASRVDEQALERAHDLLQEAAERLVLPVDLVVAERAESGAESRIVEGDVPQGWQALDIGPKTVSQFINIINGAATVVWNGPLGMIEQEPFRKGTEAVARALAQSSAISVVGGGDTGEVVTALSLEKQFDHLSTGGGAFLEYLKSGSLPALECLDRN